MNDGTRERAVEELQREIRELRERDASRLIDVWVANYGPIPWKKAVRIVEIVCRVPYAETEALLHLADDNDSEVA